MDNLHIDLAGWHESAVRRESLRAERRRQQAELHRPGAAANPARPRPIELFLFAYDTALYDRSARRYRIDEVLDEGEREFGGYDQILLWQPYPRFGLCPRNQWDFWSDLPGGLPALRALVDRCHHRDTSVLLNYIRWDATGVPEAWQQGAPEDFVAHGREVVRLLTETGADGIFGDTLKDCPAILRAEIDRLRPGLIYEGEYAPEAARPGLGDEAWTQGLKPAPLLPPRLRWLLPEFQLRAVSRGTDQHDWMVAQAMFWGMGAIVWENVFGWWNPYRARARAFLRRAAPLLRAHADAFADPEWEPLETAPAEGVHANVWRTAQKTVVTLLNENDSAATITLPLPEAGGRALATYDAWNGARLPASPDGRVTLTIEGRAPGVVIAVPATEPAPVLARPFRAFSPTGEDARRRVMDSSDPGAIWLQRRRDGAIWNDRLSADGAELLVEETGFRTRVTAEAFAPRPVAPAVLSPAADSTTPEGMFQVPGGRFVMQVRHLALWREGGCYHNPNSMDHSAQPFWLQPYFLDRCSVSRAQFQGFLEATGYGPADPQNFLRDWVKPDASDTRGWSPPPGTESWPVTWVDLDDARAYANWAGKRLPREEEWQFAAQGSDGRTWPWGSEWDPARCHHDAPTPSPVNAYANGASPFGCLGMTGNVWEWTESERDDGHTRFAIVRGGSHHTIRTSFWGKMWYAAEGAQPCDAHEKFHLLAPGLDRCANVGFRCAADCPAGTHPHSAGLQAASMAPR